MADMAKEMAPALPDLPEVNIDTEGLQARARAMAQNREKISGWVTSTLAKLAELRGVPEEDRRMAVDEIAAAQTTLRELYDHDEPAYRRAARLARFLHLLSQSFASNRELNIAFEELTEEGWVGEDPLGPLQVYRKRYSISPDCGFGEQEMVVVQQALSDTLKRISLEVSKNWADKTAAVLGLGTLTRQELRAGKKGIFSAGVPRERVEPANGAAPYDLPGGSFAVECDGRGKIWPVDGTGSIGRALAQTKELGVFLEVSDLASQGPPFVLAAEDYGRKAHFLWHLLQRAFRTQEAAEETAERMRVAKEEMAAKVTVPAAEWFLRKALGTCLAEYPGVWHEKERDSDAVSNIPHLFFLISRRGKRGQKGVVVLQILEVPEHLGDFLGDCMGEYPDQEKFWSCPHPLQRVLQAVYGSHAKAARINE